MIIMRISRFCKVIMPKLFTFPLNSRNMTLFSNKPVKSLNEKIEKTYIHVTLNQGELRGTLETTNSGTLYSSFKGIPYGIPPIGALRFAAPLAHKKWDGILDAFEHGSVCPQWDIVTGKIIESNEDCLFLNVYVPFNKNSKIPVMVWFHGGGFISGSGNSFLYGPDYLIEENVILITVNYRLEALGFLGLDNKEVSGNAGMKDQVMALKWVKENISKFGGDPNNVTIFGESAGGICCTYHLVSPMSRGLFHKVIAQSGCFLNEWGRTFDNNERAFRLGKHLGIDTKDKSELLAYLRSLPAVNLTKATLRVLTKKEKFRGQPIGFAIIKEDSYEGQESFLPKTAKKCLLDNDFAHVPILMGYNDMEGIITLKSLIKRSQTKGYDFARSIPRTIASKISDEVINSMMIQLKQFYFGGKTIGNDTLNEAVHMESDSVISYNVQRFARDMAKKSTSPVYLYRFSTDSELNISKKMTRFKYLKGACHGDDVFCLFKTFVEVENESFEHKAIKRMTRMWANFAKYSNPTPNDDSLLGVKWKPIANEEINFLDIGIDLKTGLNPDNERYEFWSKLYNQVEEFKRKMKKSHL